MCCTSEVPKVKPGDDSHVRGEIARLVRYRVALRDVSYEPHENTKTNDNPAKDAGNTLAKRHV